MIPRARITVLAATSLALAGCQVIFGIDPDQPLVARSCRDGRPLICDDFESGAIETKVWTVDATSATGRATVDAEHVHGGKFALHTSSNEVMADVMEAGGTISHYEPLGTHFFVRYFAFVPAPLPAKNVMIFNDVQIKSGHAGMQLNLVSGNLGLTSWANMPTLNVPSRTAFTPDAWHCIEWEVIKIDSDANQNVWLDGQPVGDLDLDGKITSTTYDQFTIGISFSSPVPQDPFDMWIDDVRVDTERVGCD